MEGLGHGMHPEAHNGRLEGGGGGGELKASTIQGFGVGMHVKAHYREP